MKQVLSRRTFLKGSAACASIAAGNMLPGLATVAFAESCTNNKTIVQIDLSGGLAGHMFLAPMGNGPEVTSYIDYNIDVALGRPNPAQNPNPLTLDNPVQIGTSPFGLHPALDVPAANAITATQVNYPFFSRMINDPASPFKLAVVNKTGYPNWNGSHDDSRRIQQTAIRNNNDDAPGWIGRLMDTYCVGKTLPVFSFAGNERDLVSQSGLSVVIDNITTFVYSNDAFDVNDSRYRRSLSRSLRDSFANDQTPNINVMQGVLKKTDTTQDAVLAANNSYNALTVGTQLGNRADYTNTGGLGNQLREVAKLIRGGINPTAALVSIGGFDLHTNGVTGTRNLLNQVNRAVASFLEDLRLGGVADRVIVVSYTDFGRNCFSNGNQDVVNGQPVNVSGHDHGAASIMFTIATNAIAGVHGPGFVPADFYNPRLVQGAPGVILPQVDFRDVREEVLRQANMDPARIFQDTVRLPAAGLRLFA